VKIDEENEEIYIYIYTNTHIHTYIHTLHENLTIEIIEKKENKFINLEQTNIYTTLKPKIKSH